MNKEPWQEVLGWNTDLLHTLRCTGYAYLKEGKYEKAKVYFEGLMTIDPNSLYDIRTLSCIYLYLGDAKRALPLIDKALVFGGFDYPTLLNRAKALLLLGERQEGLKAIEQLQKCPKKEIADDAKALFLAYQ